MSDDLYKDLNQLGTQSDIPRGPDQAVLERIENPKKTMPYCVRFTAPEFTSLCPKTGAPDFAHLVIDYVPNNFLIESKSLKLFLGSFRNHGSFHEDCTLEIAHRIIKTAIPTWLRIGGYWYPRGGMPIDVFYQTSAEPKDVWIPPQDVPNYKGRG